MDIDRLFDEANQPNHGYAPPGPDDYTIPEDKLARAAEVEAELRDHGAMEEDIHIILAVGDPQYTPPCCGTRGCAFSHARLTAQIVALEYMLGAQDDSHD